MSKFTRSVMMSFIMGTTLAGTASAAPDGKDATVAGQDMSLPQIYVAPVRNTNGGGGRGGGNGGAGDNLGDHVMRRVLNANGNRIVNIREVHMVTGGKITNVAAIEMDGGRITDVGGIEMDDAKIVGLADAENDADAVNLRTLALRMAAARDNLGDQIMRADVLYGDARVIDMSKIVRNGSGGITVDPNTGKPLTESNGLRIETTMIRNMGWPYENGDAANKKYVDQKTAEARDNLGDHVMRMDLDANGKKIVNLAHPTNLFDAVNLKTLNLAIADAKLSTSDRRLKENIAPITPEAGMEMVRRFEPVTYDFKADGSHAAGVIAQDLREVMPYAVHERDNKTLAVEYMQMIAPMISAIQSLDNRLSALEEAAR